MSNNKLVLEMCPNFYRIINYEYFEEDVVTEKLIKIYEDFIFKANLQNDEEAKAVKRIDYVLGKYIDDNFKITDKYLEDMENKLLAIVENIIAIFNHYEEDTTRCIYIAKWI